MAPSNLELLQIENNTDQMMNGVDSEDGEEYEEEEINPVENI